MPFDAGVPVETKLKSGNTTLLALLERLLSARCRCRHDHQSR